MADELANPRAEPWAGLSQKAKHAVELVADGKSRRKAAEVVGLSHQAVNNACKSPAGIRYRQFLDNQNKGDLYSATLAELRRRVVEWGSVPMKDLIAILRVLLPQEVNLTVQDRDIELAAERLAERTGLPKDRTIIDIRERLKGAS